MVFGTFHDGAFCERAAPDAPETIDDQRRCTGCRYRTIYGGSRGSASLPALAKSRNQREQTISGPACPTEIDMVNEKESKLRNLGLVCNERADLRLN